MGYYFTINFDIYLSTSFSDHCAVIHSAEGQFIVAMRAKSSPTWGMTAI
jgi:hypothetical protein